MIRWMLGEIVAIANSGGKCYWWDWYATKDAILKRWGKPDGCDQQIFECWPCDGTGDNSWNGACWKCGGSGIYRRVSLLRFRLGRRVFHRPDAWSWDGEGRIYNSVIRGHVEHRRRSPHLRRFCLALLCGLHCQTLKPFLKAWKAGYAWRIRSYLEDTGLLLGASLTYRLPGVHACQYRGEDDIPF